MARRRVRRNGAIGSIASAVGGLVAVPLASGAATAISEKVAPTSAASSLGARGALFAAGAAAVAFSKRESSPAFAWGGVVGAAATALLWWNYRRDMLDREALASSYPAPAPLVGGWHELPSGPISMVEGMAYRAAVDLPFYVPSSAATDERIQSYAADRGFRVTRIYREQPDGSWPPDADLWVEAVALRAGELERPGALVWAAFKG